MKGRVLAIAGSDSGGGAGIQADIKTITALGGYAMSAITALTAQDTQGVRAVHKVPAEFVRLQIDMALADPGADAVKTGMLGDAAVIAEVAAALAGCGFPLVVDPVMTAKGGATLMADAARGALMGALVPLATLFTPNLPEAEALLGMRISSVAGMRDAAMALCALGANSVLLKGGHLDGLMVVDVLANGLGVEEFAAPRIETRHTHGTGCTLASAIATGLAQGMALRDAVIRARAYLRAAIATAPGYGVGHGPLDHGVTVDPRLIEGMRR